MNRFALLLSIVLPAACGLADTTQPTPPVEHLKATVTGVEGLVQVRTDENQPWQKATEGMEVGENAEFRTGPRSAVRFTIPPDQTVTLDRLGTIKVLQAISDHGKLTTNLGMKYGRTRYDIEAAGREHESTISSPSSTLAVRGTKVSLYDQRPFPAEAISLTGRAEFTDFKKHTFFGKKNAGKTVINTQTSNAAAFALGQTVIDPNSSLARTRSEEPLIASLLSSGATLSFDYDKGIRVVTGGTVPRTDNELIPTLPGTFDFVMRWTGNSNVNLGVVEPGNGTGHTIYPQAGFDLLPSGGQTSFDHRGGPNGGIEVAFYPATFPSGRYFVGAQLISGPSTPATLDVFRDGVRVPINVGDHDVTTVNFIAAPVNPSLDISGIAVGIVNIQPGGNATAQSITSTSNGAKATSSFAGPMPMSGSRVSKTR